ncbi:oligosaccharide flippase family protein [Luteimonas sp. BDR2-5]|uniref:oligosaccharide flippase family protein n=1 Tax=Proluteimonas luteida TaxID=2878685 RepID=UPI001E402383|nr:oligosaccharide flippase family protein [Luteimonas sp. BDR2-5]
MSRFCKDVVTVVLGRSVIRASQFVSFILLARFLTVEEFGWFGLISSAITMAVMLGSLGLRQSIAYHVGNGVLTLKQSMGSIACLFPLLAAGSSLAVFALYGKSTPATSYSFVLVAVGTAVSCALLIAVLQGILLATGNIKAFSLTETSPRVVVAILVAMFVVFGFLNLDTALASYAAGFLVVAPWLFFSALKLAGGFSLPRWDQLKNLVLFGLGFAVNLFLIFGISRIGIFVLEHYHEADSAGLLFAAVRVNEILLEIAAAIGIVVFSNAVQKNVEDADFVDRTSRLACLVFWSFSALGVVIALVGTQMVTLVAGEKYAGAGDALSILALVLGAASANKVIYPAVAGRGQPFFGTPSIMLGIIFSCAAAIMLVPTKGLVGAAIAIAGGQMVIFLSYIVSFRVTYKTPLTRFLIPRMCDVRQILSVVKRRLGRRR